MDTQCWLSGVCSQSDALVTKWGNENEWTKQANRVELPLWKSWLKYRLHHGVQLFDNLLAIRGVLLEFCLDSRLRNTFLQTHKSHVRRTACDNMRAIAARKIQWNTSHSKILHFSIHINDFYDPTLSSDKCHPEKEERPTPWERRNTHTETKKHPSLKLTEHSYPEKDGRTVTTKRTKTHTLRKKKHPSLTKKYHPYSDKERRPVPWTRSKTYTLRKKEHPHPKIEGDSKL